MALKNVLQDERNLACLCSTAHAQVQSGSDGLCECALHCVVGRWFPFDLRNYILLFQARFCSRAAGNDGHYFQVIGIVIQHESSAVEDVWLAIVRVFLKVHLPVRTIEDHGELTQNMKSNVTGNGSGGLRALRVGGKNGDRPDHLFSPSSSVSARVKKPRSAPPYPSPA